MEEKKKDKDSPKDEIMPKAHVWTIVVAPIMVLILPFFLEAFIYPAFQVFLPYGNIVLTPLLRVLATLVIAALTYLAVILVLHKGGWAETTLSKIILAFIICCYCFFCGFLWYIAVI